MTQSATPGFALIILVLFAVAAVAVALIIVLKLRRQRTQRGFEVKPALPVDQGERSDV